MIQFHLKRSKILCFQSFTFAFYLSTDRAGGCLANANNEVGYPFRGQTSLFFSSLLATRP